MADAYFTPEEFKDHFPDDAEVQALSEEEIDAARLTAEEIIERACNVAFVVRERTETLSPGRSHWLETGINMIRSVDTLTINGTENDVSLLKFDGSRIWRHTRFAPDLGNVEVEFTHGYDAPSREIKEAAMTLTKHRAIKGPIDDRATSISAGEAGGTITLLTPGVRGSVTGIPSVDRAIEAHRFPRPTAHSIPMFEQGNSVGRLGESWDDE